MRKTTSQLDFLRALALLLVTCLITCSSATPSFTFDSKKQTTKALTYEDKNFKTDKDISQFLKLLREDAMLLRVDRTIQRKWYGQPLTIDLYSEVIGSRHSLIWKKNTQPLVNGLKYTLSVRSHLSYPDKVPLQKWLEYRLRIHSATPFNSGMYTVQLKGKKTFEEENVFVDIIDARNEVNPERLQQDEVKNAPSSNIPLANVPIDPQKLKLRTLERIDRKKLRRKRRQRRKRRKKERKLRLMRERMRMKTEVSKESRPQKNHNNKFDIRKEGQEYFSSYKRQKQRLSLGKQHIKTRF